MIPACLHIGCPNLNLDAGVVDMRIAVAGCDCDSCTLRRDRVVATHTETGDVRLRRGSALAVGMGYVHCVEQRGATHGL